MKYIDKEKLVNEINSRLAFYLGTAYSVKDTNRVDGLNEVLEIIESLQQEQPEADLNSKVTFDCISKKVTMSVQELINYYIEKECCDAAYECGF